MKKFLYLIIICTICLFSLTGCYKQIGIDKFYYIIALGIDSSDNNLLKISVQTINNSSSSDSSSFPSTNYKIYSAEAETIDSAITILNNYLDKKINLSHCSAIVISETLARDGIQTYFNTFSNNTELRDSCKLLISSSTAYDVLDKVSNSGEIFSSRLYDYLTNSTSYTGYTIDSTFGTLFQALENNYKQPSAIYTKTSENTIQNFGIAVFKEDKMVGTLDSLDTISHLIVTNELNNCMLTIPHPSEENEKIDIDFKLYKKTKISIDIINNSPFISLDIFPEGTIRSSGNHLDYSNNSNFENVEKSLNTYLENIIKTYLYKISKEYDSDISGFSGKFSSKFLTEKDFQNQHWDKIFKDSFFKINIYTRINSSKLFNKQ